MYLQEFHGIRVAGMACAVPNHYEKLQDYAQYFPEGEVERFCSATGIYGKYSGTGVGVTAADLGVVAAERIFEAFDIDRKTIDGLIFVTQTPDYHTPPTACVIQYRLGLENCGLVYDSNIGCTGFPFGIQMACANLAVGCEKVLLIVGDSDTNRRTDHVTKDSLLFGDAVVAIVLEKTKEDVTPIHVGIHTIGAGYQALFTPYGMKRHPLQDLYAERGEEYALRCNNACFMKGSDVFTFSIKDAPKTAKAFYERFNCSADCYDLISIHQANKMIVENVAKRIKAPMEKVPVTFDRFGNTRGASTAINICDYAQRTGIYSGNKKILNLAFGIGLNVVLADLDLDMSRCLPLIKTTEAFDDGITNFTDFEE